VQIDGLRQVLPQQLDVVAVLGAGARPEIEGGTKDPALTRFWCTLLRPVQQAMPTQ
jgi:hypothetical protein